MELFFQNWRYSTSTMSEKEIMWIFLVTTDPLLEINLTVQAENSRLNMALPVHNFGICMSIQFLEMLWTIWGLSNAYLTLQFMPIVKKQNEKCLIQVSNHRFNTYLFNTSVKCGKGAQTLKNCTYFISLVWQIAHFNEKTHNWFLCQYAIKSWLGWR